MSKVANAFFRHRDLTRKAKQILLLLDSVADPTTRISEVTQTELQTLTGYPRRTVQRAMRQLADAGHLKQAGRGRIQLLYQAPKKEDGCYVLTSIELLTYEGWSDWQKQLLLFLMSHYRDTDPDFHVNHYELRWNQVEKCCSIPGADWSDRKPKAKAFIQELCNEGILVLVDKANNKHGAIYTLNLPQLWQLITPPTPDVVESETAPPARQASSLTSVKAPQQHPQEDVLTFQKSNEPTNQHDEGDLSAASAAASEQPSAPLDPAGCAVGISAARRLLHSEPRSMLVKQETRDGDLLTLLATLESEREGEVLDVAARFAAGRCRPSTTPASPGAVNR